uniref:Nipped-B protein n=1 Tax=Meloidogyne javanica TaxID=6303 RepID=A0A915M9B9_MELJA
MIQDTQQMEGWNTDTAAENDSFDRFTTLVDQILDQVDEEMSTLPTSTMSLGLSEESGFSIEKSVLEKLRIEAQKLKFWQKLSDMPTEKLVKLVTVLEKNIREFLIDDDDVDGTAFYARIRGNESDETDEAFRELIDERLLKSVDAALTALCIMTSRRMPKQVLVEDVFELSVQLCKQCLQEVIYPNTDNSLKVQSSKLRKSGDCSFIKKRNISRNINTSQLYSRLLDLLTCFSELARLHSLSETLMIQLSSLCTPPFFVENVPEVQKQSIKLLPIIFAKCPTLRRTILLDLLNMVHKLPLTRNIRNSHRLSANESIGNFTVLILQLIQSALPPRKTVHHKNDYRHEKIIRDSDDKIVVDSFDEAKKLAAFFLGGFLGKCTAKAEDDYRRLFELFLSDILVALHRPMWPVAEMILTVLGNLLVVHYRSKTFDLSLRIASLDYLGIITARLRKDRVAVLSAESSAQEKDRLNSIVKSILFDENAYDPSYNVEDVDISHLSSSEKIRKLEQALFDYIIGTMWEKDYVLRFYAVEWYRETVLDVEVCKERHAKASGKGDVSRKESQKNDQKIQRISEKGQSMKLFIMGLTDKQHIKRRRQFIVKNGTALVECDANWVVKYLASKKELSQLFDVYLRRILEGFKPDLYPVAIRTKAMKCLAQIVEADSQVLMIDTAVAVRKRVIRILKEVVHLRPKINDEEGVKKMCIETFQQLWMIPTRDAAKLDEKVRLLVETAVFSIGERSEDYVGTLITLLVKNSQEQDIIIASKQIVDALVNYVLNLEKESVRDQGLDEVSLVKSTQDYQTRLSATLTILSFFAKARSELLIGHIEVFIPYLSISSSSPLQDQLLSKIIEMLQEIIPMMDSYNTSQTLIRQLDTRLSDIVKEGCMNLIDSAISCMAEIQLKFLQNEEQPSICRLFIVFYKYLKKQKPELKLDERSNNSTSSTFNIPKDKVRILCHALYSIGSMCRYFDFDILLKNEQRDLFIDINPASDSNEQEHIVSNSVFSILVSYFSYYSYNALSQMALIALVQVLKNIARFLSAEEQRALKRAAQVKLDQEQQTKQQEENSLIVDDVFDKQQKSKLNVDNLKEMELDSSGLSSSVIQQYWNAILTCYFHNDENVRINSAQVIRQTLEQGLVTPGSSIPTLIAMSTDYLSQIRIGVDILIRDMNTKYKGLILVAVAGIRLSFELQKKIRGNANKIIRGFRANDNPLNSNRASTNGEKLLTHSVDVTALLSIFYINVRANRQNRRTFLSSLLKIFSEENSDKTEQEEWLFLSDNLAHFPYTVMDEPLYVIHQADTIISVSGQNILSQLRQLLVPAHLERSLGSSKDETNSNKSISIEEPEEFSVEHILKNLPEDKKKIYELRKNSHACFILLHLKKFLMNMYGFREDKVSEYSPSEPTNVYEKPVNRRNIPVFSPAFILNEIGNESQTVDLDIKIAQDFHRFHEMLLSLDDKKNEEETSAISVDEESNCF